MIKKITHGFVTQDFDETTNQWVAQEFTCGDQCEYERDGEPIDEYDFTDAAGGIAEPYLPYDMVQPSNDGQKPTDPLNIASPLPNGEVPDWFSGLAAAYDASEGQPITYVLDDLRAAVSCKPNQNSFETVARLIERLDCQCETGWSRSLVWHSRHIANGHLSGRGPNKPFRYKYSDSRRPVSATSNFFGLLSQALGKVSERSEIS